MLNAQLAAIAEKNQGIVEVAAAWNAATRKIIAQAQTTLGDQMTS